MKALKFLLIGGIATLIIISCSNPVYVQKDDTADFSKYKTYMWVDTRASENDNSARTTAFMDISMRNEVNKKLAKKGWREVTDNPDVLISYDVLVERTTQTQSDPVYSRPFTRYYYNPYMRRWGTIYYPSQFYGYQSYEVPVKEATVTITMSDARTDKGIWQGWTTDQLNNSRPTNNEIAKSVRQIFKKFDEVS
jgi:tRNA U54 and U55 pseudouridine synthase Pus10